MWLQRENWINNSFFIQHSIEWKIPILRKIKQILIQQNCNNKIIHRNINALSNVVFDFKIPFPWLRNYILYNPMFYLSKSILRKENLKVITFKPQLVYYVCLVVPTLPSAKHIAIYNRQSLQKYASQKYNDFCLIICKWIEWY